MISIIRSLFLASFFFASAFSHSELGTGFALMPAHSTWALLVQNLRANEISDAVHIYMQPFREYQLAARNRDITPQQLKSSFLAAVDILEDSVRNLIITSDEYGPAKDNTEPFLTMSTAVFKLKKAESVAPVFNISTLEAFSRQRLKHMIGVKKTNYINFLIRKNTYQSILKEWGIIGSRLPKCEFRKLMARNIDLQYVEHMTAVYLDVLRLRGNVISVDKMPKVLKYFGKLRQDEVVNNIKTLGNGYSTSSPPYSSFLIVVCTFYAILITVMF